MYIKVDVAHNKIGWPQNLIQIENLTSKLKEKCNYVN